MSPDEHVRFESPRGAHHRNESSRCRIPRLRGLPNRRLHPGPLQGGTAQTAKRTPLQTNRNLPLSGGEGRVGELFAKA